MAAPISPVSPLPSVGQTFVVAAGVALEAPIQPYANTKEVVILNLDAVNQVYVQWVQGGVLPAALAAANSTIIPPSGSLVLAVGSEGKRHQAGTVAFWAANPGSGIILAFDASAGNPTVNLTYVNESGN